MNSNQNTSLSQHIDVKWPKNTSENDIYFHPNKQLHYVFIREKIVFITTSNNKLNSNTPNNSKFKYTINQIIIHTNDNDVQDEINKINNSISDSQNQNNCIQINNENQNSESKFHFAPNEQNNIKNFFK